MSLSNDYFLLYHGLTFQKSIDSLDFDFKYDEELFRSFSILLSITRRDFDKVRLLNSFKLIHENLNLNVSKNLEDLNQLQNNIIQYITNNYSKDKCFILQESFSYLNNEGFLSKDNYKKLCSLFDFQNLYVDKNEQQEHKKKKFSFKDEKEYLLNTLENIQKLIHNKEILVKIENLKTYINKQKFSIGITGVMNAGKSTMLNALMGKEILGSSVVPETANLTVINYDKEESANVVYWDKEQWTKIIKSSEKIAAMKEFVEETNSAFKNNLDEYIKEKSRVDTVYVNDLSSYTSAKHSGKKCNIIQHVELKTPLEFLKDGIEIVDTPGLDDPVIQREEITKEYINNCDMMIHLMNVSQSATLKDVEFIIDALLYQNVTKLLVVITRADTVSKEQLKEVIKYTKSSIQKELNNQNKDSKLDFILNNIKFIPISGKMALLHRTNQEQIALDAGFTLEDTGIFDIENYLNENLFGNSSIKSELIVKSAKIQLLNIILVQEDIIKYELKLISKSKDELEEELKLFEKNKQKKQEKLSSISEDIHYYKEDSKNYTLSLENFLISELLDLKMIIRQRVVSDVRYSYETTKAKPNNSRIKVIVQTAIKDGIIDIIRDYKYKFIKKFQTISEQCEIKYKNLDFQTSQNFASFDPQELFKNDFKSGFLVSSNEILINEILKNISNSKANKINELDESIKNSIESSFDNIQNDIKSKTKSLSNSLIELFFEVLNKPIIAMKQKLQDDENILKNHLELFEKDKDKKVDLSLDLHNKLKHLEQISSYIKGQNDE